MIDFKTLISRWLREYHPLVSQIDYVIYSTGKVEDTRLYVCGMMIGWITDKRLVLGRGTHYSNMVASTEPLDHTDPNFFAEVDSRLRRIGA